ncbi:uncharacterized protein C8A04DRAFT_32088 [Dichotomopilus funicola]|uniref:Amidoligase enzyme-domain-containing protein n=1 Tax=Dichotomopilus funicola TaxID=1934379 RepID=A0AAN6UXP0_9PEZI|nr:hypothetical protein C8A04DRAFT_32088 [Dichotomopilus funicola]
MAPFLEVFDHDRQNPKTINTAHSINYPGQTITNTTDQRRVESGDVHQTTEVDLLSDISVALEWKLLVPLLLPGADDPQPEDVRPIVEARCADSETACLEQAHDLIAQTITDAGEKAIADHARRALGLEEKRFWQSSWLVKKANSAEPLDDEKALKGYVWVKVEICSPKMLLNAAGAESLGRMQKVLGALSSSHRLFANCSCEVHIHLGQIHGQAWSLPTLKRLGSLLWLAEPTLRSIRDPKSPNFHNTYTWGFAMRQHSRLAHRVKDATAEYVDAPRYISDRQIKAAIRDQFTASTTDLAAFGEIWKAESHLELGQLLSGEEKKYRRLGFNFSAFGQEDDRARSNPRTMEFRMMEGSVQTDLILGWLAICGTIAECAVAADDHRFAAAMGLLLQRSSSADNGKASEAEERRATRLGKEFRELMESLAVAEQHFVGFEKKVELDHL